MSHENSPPTPGPLTGILPDDDAESTGFEFPSDPDADLPVPARRSPDTAWQPAASDPVVFTPPPAAPYVPPAAPAPAPYAPPVYAPAPVYVPPAATAGPTPIPDVEPVTASDVNDLLGFDPETLTHEDEPAATTPPARRFASPPPPPTGAYVAPQVARAPHSVPVADPRGSLALADGDDGNSIKPKTPLTAGEGRPEIERLLIGLVVNNGSDMHIVHGEVPRYRVAGSLLPIAGEQHLTTADIERMLRGIVTPNQWEEFERTHDLDCAYAMDERDGAALTTRFRVNVFRSMDETGAVFRVIPTKIVTLDQLGVPAQVKKLAEKPRGLILFCGPTGSGKSTSMAGLVDLINETRTERIFTLEDPIEFTHVSKKSLISHREVGQDTESFVEGLKRVRREDPDVILIGEMRDYETIGAAIEAADTGHLVIGTLHTNSAPETISRIINSFPAERQDQIRVTLSSTLLAVICQTLVPSPTAPRGRVVATEIMMVTPGIANNIRENDIPSIVNALTDRESGSISLDAHLVELIRENKITRKEAGKKASSVEALERQLGNTDK